MYACAGCRNPRSSRYRFMPGIKNLPDHWNQEISRQQPDRHQDTQDYDNNWDWPSREKGVRGVQGVAGVQVGVQEQKVGGQSQAARVTLSRGISVSRQRVAPVNTSPLLLSLNSCNSSNSSLAISDSLTNFRPVSS